MTPNSNIQHLWLCLHGLSIDWPDSEWENSSDPLGLQWSLQDLLIGFTCVISHPITGRIAPRWSEHSLITDRSLVSTALFLKLLFR